MSIGRLCVVVSTYNGGSYLEQQIESIEEQTVIPDLIYIRDDGSSDNTKEIIRNLARAYPNISFALGSNVGWRKSFVEALSNCGEFDWYAFCDQDDYWLPTKIEAALDALQQAPANVPVLYAGNVTVADSDLNPSHLFNREPVDIINKDCPHTLTRDEMAGGLTYVFNKHAKRLLVAFQPRGITGHDRILMLICKLYGRVVYDSDSHVLYRQHGGNAIGASAGQAPRRTIRQKLRNLLEPDDRERQLVAGGLLALSEYGFVPNEADMSFLRLVSTLKGSLFSRLALLLRRNVGAYTFREEIKFRIKILFGDF